MLAFVGVALGAIAVLATLTATTSASDVADLVAAQKATIERAVAASAGAAWQRSGTWKGADLEPLLFMTRQVGVAMQITSNSRQLIAASPGFAELPAGSERYAAVSAAGRRIGGLTVRFPASMFSEDQDLRMDLWLSAAWASALTAALAFLVAVGVAQIVTAPVRRMIDTVRARGGGDRQARAGAVGGPQELQELARSLDQMADATDRQESIRRNLIADISHELRTPAAVLVAGSEALIDHVVEPTPEQLNSFHDEAQRLSYLINDLQRLSSAEAASLELTMTPCDLAQVAFVASDTLGDAFEQAGVSLVRHLSAAQVSGNVGRLHEVIQNLLTNAMKYTPAGGSVLLDVRPSGGRAMLRVKDTGVGIPSDELPRIFDRFFRGQQATGMATGTGIGMTVVVALAQAHEGDIEISSQPGKGTEITITFPLSYALV